MRRYILAILLLFVCAPARAGGIKVVAHSPVNESITPRAVSRAYQLRSSPPATSAPPPPRFVLIVSERLLDGDSGILYACSNCDPRSRHHVDVALLFPTTAAVLDYLTAHDDTRVVAAYALGAELRPLRSTSTRVERETVERVVSEHAWSFESEAP